MNSSTKHFSKSKSISENQNDIPVPDEQVETGVYLSKGGIAVVISYESDNPKVIQAFEGNEDFEIMIKSVKGIDMYAMKFSNGLCYAASSCESQTKSECMPDISRHGPDFRMPYEIIWTDSDTNKVLKINFGYLSPENTKNLCNYLAFKMNYEDNLFNIHIVKRGNPFVLAKVRGRRLRHDWPVSQ
jgi:hypothetical protein